MALSTGVLFTHFCFVEKRMFWMRRDFGENNIFSNDILNDSSHPMFWIQIYEILIVKIVVIEKNIYRTQVIRIISYYK